MQTPSSSSANPRILVTGVTGFAGGHLVEALLARGERQIVGLSRGGDWGPVWKRLAGQIELRRCDLCDRAQIEAVLRDVKPGRVFHLAGYAHVGRSLSEPDAAWNGNLTATRTLYDAVERSGSQPRILFVGSGLVYGQADDPTQAPDENSPLRPTTPYGSSKAAADLLSYQVSVSPGLDVVRARPFNHVGPGQSPQFALPNFARQIVAIERQQRPPVLETGNLSSCRDLTDVRDVIAAYLLLMERGRTGEAYNVGSGQTLSMQAVLERMLSLAGLKVELRQRAELLRAVDQAVVRVNADKLRREVGWQPRFTLDQTLADTLTYWRGQL
jgi:GDP-4-dehydro-6-deoxy-D-mannose reductase